MEKLRAYFLVGPTAAGKTAVCQFIAEKHSFDILSADAMLVYRGLDIGTAKPDTPRRSRVRYFGMDLVDVHEHFSAGRYCEYALGVLQQAAAAGRPMIVTGGTGLYIKSLTHGLNRWPAGSAAVRAQAETLLKENGLAALQELVKTKARENYEALADKKNPRRLVRALERAQDTGAGSRTTWQELGKGPKLLGLSMPREQLYERIKLRVDAMYAGGLLTEAEKLLKAGLDSAPTAAQAIGYAEASAVLRGTLPLKKAVEITVRRTRQLAKRQMTWFKHQANVVWLEIDSAMPVEQIARMVLEHWEKIGPTPIAGYPLTHGKMLPKGK